MNQPGKYVVNVNDAGQIVGQATPYIEQPTPEPDVVYFDWTTTYIIAGASFVAIIIAWTLSGYPRWKVWAQRKSGEADLQQAHQEQQIQVSKAQGRLDAATLNKQAAIVEAEAVSAQIEKIGEKLTEHGLYLRWQWIKMMEERPNSSVIYVPTEANLPIMEATRFQKEKQDSSSLGTNFETQ